MSFATAFDFARSVESPYRDAQGRQLYAGVDAPRFDHERSGEPLGLLVEAGPLAGQRDRVTLADAIDITGAATVFHALRRADGVIERRAYYTMNATATINACLRQLGHHVAIGAVAGYLPGRDGTVFYRRDAWAMPPILTTGAGVGVGTGDARPLLAG